MRGERDPGDPILGGGEADLENDEAAWSRDFPWLTSGADGRLYLDSAATTLRPVQVIRAVAEFEASHAGNPGSPHHLAEAAAAAYARSRARVARYLGADQFGSVVFVRGATQQCRDRGRSFG